MAKQLYDLIEQERANLNAQLKAATDAREELNERIKELRAQLDDLPVRKVRRAKKAKTEQPEDPRSVFDVVRDMEKGA